MWPTIVEVGLAALMQAQPAFREKAAPRYVEIAARGAERPATDLAETLAVVAAVRSQTSRLFADCDIVLMPACAAMPWPAGEAFPPQIDGVAVGPRGHAVYTGWVNAAGHPAIALPCPVDGLPIGAQLVADLGGEGLLLDIADQVAQEVDLFPRWPAMALDPGGARGG